MKKAIAVISLLFLTGCGQYYTVNGHFYIKSVWNGYIVCVSNNNDTPVCISKPINDPRDADIIVKELNRDMEGNWEK